MRAIGIVSSGRKALVAAALGCGLLCTAATEAAIFVDLKVTGVSGSSDSFTDKTAKIQQGDVVTVGIYLSGLSTVTTGGGLGNYSLSVRSFNETYGGGTAWTSPTAASTVLNATSAVLPTLPAAFNTTNSGSAALKDINAISNNPDLNDTDIDVFKLSAAQSTAPYTNGVGLTDGFLLGTAQFTANTDATKALDWTVHLNTLYTTASGANGGLYLLGTGGTAGPMTTNLATGAAGEIGNDIVVTVTSVPEPSILAGLGLGLVGLLLRRCR